MPRREKSPPPNTATERVAAQPAYGFWLLMWAILAVVVVFIIATDKFANAGNIAAVVGAATGPIAALVGAFFGIRGSTYAQLAAASDAEARDRKRDQPEGDRGANRPMK